MISLHEATNIFQEQYIEAALVTFKNNKKRTARELGMSYRGFLYRLETLTKTKALRESLKALAEMKQSSSSFDN